MDPSTSQENVTHAVPNSQSRSSVAAVTTSLESEHPTVAASSMTSYVNQNDQNPNNLTIPRTTLPVTTSTVPSPDSLFSIVRRKYRSISVGNSSKTDDTGSPTATKSNPRTGALSSTSIYASASLLNSPKTSDSSNILDRKASNSKEPSRSSIFRRNNSSEMTHDPDHNNRHGDVVAREGWNHTDFISPTRPTGAPPTYSTDHRRANQGNGFIMDHVTKLMRNTNDQAHAQIRTSVQAYGADGDAASRHRSRVKSGNSSRESVDKSKEDNHRNDGDHQSHQKDMFEAVLGGINDRSAFPLRVGMHGPILASATISRSFSNSTSDDASDGFDDYETDDGTSDGNASRNSATEISAENQDGTSAPVGVHILPSIIENQSSTGNLLGVPHHEAPRVGRSRLDHGIPGDDDNKDGGTGKAGGIQIAGETTSTNNESQENKYEPTLDEAQKDDVSNDTVNKEPDTSTSKDAAVSIIAQGAPPAPTKQMAWEQELQIDEELNHLFLRRQNQYEQQRFVIVPHGNDAHHVAPSDHMPGLSELTDNSLSGSTADDLDRKTTYQPLMFGNHDKKSSRKAQSNRNRSHSLDSTRILVGPAANHHNTRETNAAYNGSPVAVPTPPHAVMRNRPSLIQKLFHHLNSSADVVDVVSQEDISRDSHGSGHDSFNAPLGSIIDGMDETTMHPNGRNHQGHNHSHHPHIHIPNPHARQTSHTHNPESTAHHQHSHDLNTIGEDDQNYYALKSGYGTGTSSRDHGTGSSNQTGAPGRPSRHYESLFTKLFHHAHLHSRKPTNEDDANSSAKEIDVDSLGGGSLQTSKPVSPELRPTDAVSSRMSMESLEHIGDPSKNGSNEAVGDYTRVVPKPIDTEATEELSPDAINSNNSPIRSPKNMASREESVSELATSPRDERHSNPTHVTPFSFLKPRTSGSVERRPREKSDSEGSYSLFKDLRTTIQHRRGNSNSAASRISDDHDAAATSHTPPASSTSAAPPKSINRTGSDAILTEKYGKPDEVLGKGANAVVRLVTQRRDDSRNGKSRKDGKYFAIKEFRKRRKDETEKEYIKKVISEFCISSSIHHENIVETVDLIRDDHGRWCVVMEYCAGGDLFHKASSIGFSNDDEIYCLFRQLLNGVGYIHSIGVTHRDLKPENILLDASGRIIKITDFGTSAVFRTQWETEAHKLQGVCGSAPYIAPEEWEEQHEYIPTKVDVWASGMIFYAMLSKSLLWGVAKPTDAHYAAYLKKRDTGFPQFERYSEGPRRILYAILDPDPARRPEITHFLQDEWIKTIEYCHSLSDDKALNHVEHIHKLK